MLLVDYKSVINELLNKLLSSHIINLVVLKKWRDGVAMPVIPDSLEVECERILV
jgi:hypothetical protein